MSDIKIVLADDHPVVRQGIRSRLNKEEDFDLVGEAGDGLEAVSLVDKYKPDVLILDMLMPGLNGLEVIPRVKKISPNTKVVILSINDDESYVLQALVAGAKAYVLKNSPLEVLIFAVREASVGNHYLGPPLSQWAVEMYMQKAISDSPKFFPNKLYDQLTEREQEIFHLILEDLTNAEIADKLSISRRTVESHRANLMNKLGVKSKLGLLAYAVEQGFITSSDSGQSS